MFVVVGCFAGQAASVARPRGVCFKEVLGQQHGVQCQSDCLRCFHKDCAKVSSTEYARLSSDDKIIWQCARACCARAECVTS